MSQPTLARSVLSITGYQADDLIQVVRCGGWCKEHDSDQSHVLESVRFVIEDGEVNRLWLEMLPGADGHMRMFRLTVETLPQPNKVRLDKIVISGYGVSDLLAQVHHRWRPLEDGPGLGYVGIQIVVCEQWPRRLFTNQPSGKLDAQLHTVRRDTLYAVSLAEFSP